ILNNTADNYYGGIYHCAGYIELMEGTRITGNKNEGYYGGGVYSQKVPIYLSGNVQVYGNYSQGDLRQPCDVNFGKSLNEAFILKGGMGYSAMIGVYTTSGTTPTYWCRDYHLYDYGGCKNMDKYAESLKDCLFSNSGDKGFVYSDRIDSHSQDRTWHHTMVSYGGSAAKYDVKVTQVRYKGVLLSPSEYSSDYNPNSRTITLNVPDYVTDTYLLQVKANVKDSNDTWGSGHDITFEDRFDISERQALIINTLNKSPNYTVTVEGGMVDGKGSATKKYLEPFSIAPTVPEGKVFSHWEIEGGNADDIPGFEKYAKSPANLEMPQHDVTFKAVFREEVSRVDITLPQPQGGDVLSNNTSATVLYTVNGVETTENVDITWRKHIIDKKQDKFDFNTLYTASFSFSDSPDGNFGLADANEFIIYVNGTELSKENYKYLNHFENGGGVYGTVEDSDPIKQRRVNITYPYQTAKAKVLEVEKPTIEILTGTNAEALKNLLPDSVKITYEGIDGDKTASAPVSWNTASLSGTVQSEITINGTVTISEALDATDDKKQTAITVKVTSDKQRLAKPSASVNDGEKIAINTKITLSAEDGATIWYKIDDGAFAQYNSENGIVPQGEAGKIVDRKITAYCTKDGYLQSEFLTLNIEIDNESVHTVKIVDKNGAIYGYASGAGEYEFGADVTIKATESDPEKFVSSWSAEGITLEDAQKTAAEFTFAMPAHDVTITAESFRYYVSKLYLSSITPIADNPLPQTLEIIGAEDINGNVFDKNDILLKVELNQWQKYNEDKGLYEPIESSSISENGKKYLAAFSVEPNSGVKASCDNLEIFIDDEKIIPDISYQGHYIIGWDFTAVYDELKSVNLGDSITAYTGNYVDFPEEIGVKTKYGSITTANVTWTGTDNVNTSTAGDYNVIATLTLPDNVIAADDQKNISVTVKVRSLISSVALETVGGNAPAKSGDSLPASLNVKSDSASLVENSFSVSPNNEAAVSDAEYTIKARVAPAENYEFAANTIFTINGISMNASPAENGEYELTYTFTAQDGKSYDVIVNGGASQKYEEGNTVSISTPSSDFYKWTAEVVYETTETVIDETDNTKTKDVVVTHRNPINIFADGNEYKAETSFVMPKLADGSRLEIEAEYVGINYNEKTKCAEIISDKDYTGIKIIFAAYSNGELALVKSVDADLAEGFNTVTAPEDFSTDGADTIKVMVWENFDDIKPLFEAYA
ncbi:MAG: Ig-like domain-containing protein, partial [Monoglobaceae bacterium]